MRRRRRCCCQAHPRCHLPAAGASLSSHLPMMVPQANIRLRHHVETVWQKCLETGWTLFGHCFLLNLSFVLASTCKLWPCTPQWPQILALRLRSLTCGRKRSDASVGWGQGGGCRHLKGIYNWDVTGLPRGISASACKVFAACTADFRKETRVFAAAAISAFPVPALSQLTKKLLLMLLLPPLLLVCGGAFCLPVVVERISAQGPYCRKETTCADLKPKLWPYPLRVFVAASVSAIFSS